MVVVQLSSHALYNTPYSITRKQSPDMASRNWNWGDEMFISIRYGNMAHLVRYKRSLMNHSTSDGVCRKVIYISHLYLFLAWIAVNVRVHSMYLFSRYYINFWMRISCQLIKFVPSPALVLLNLFKKNMWKYYRTANKGAKCAWEHIARAAAKQTQIDLQQQENKIYK